MVGQAAGVATIRAHHVNIPVAVALGHEGDLTAIRRPRRRPVVGRVVGQAAGVATIRIHHVNLPVAVTLGREGDVTAIWRPRKRAAVRGQVVYPLKRQRQRIGVGLANRTDYPNVVGARLHDRRHLVVILVKDVARTIFYVYVAVTIGQAADRPSIKSPRVSHGYAEVIDIDRQHLASR